jgi:hypothetical protein
VGWTLQTEPEFSSSVSNGYDIERVSDELLLRRIQIPVLESEGSNLPGKLQSYIWI